MLIPTPSSGQKWTFYILHIYPLLPTIDFSLTLQPPLLIHVVIEWPHMGYLISTTLIANYLHPICLLVFLCTCRYMLSLYWLPQLFFCCWLSCIRLPSHPAVMKAAVDKLLLEQWRLSRFKLRHLKLDKSLCTRKKRITYLLTYAKGNYIIFCKFLKTREWKAREAYKIEVQEYQI